MVASSLHTTFLFYIKPFVDLQLGRNSNSIMACRGSLSAESVPTILKGLWGVVRMRALHKYGFTVIRTKMCRNGRTNQLIHTRSQTGRSKRKKWTRARTPDGGLYTAVT